jgi:hypothetical protein
MHRFSIGTLMVVIVVAALGLVALRNVHDWSAALLPLMAAVAQEVAILSAMFLRGPYRFWWVATALSVGGYLFLTLDPELSSGLGTTYVLEYAYAKLTPAENGSTYVDLRDLPVDDRLRPFLPEIVTFDAFQRIGHAIFALLVGVTGGTAALWVRARRERATVAAGQTQT